MMNKIFFLALALALGWATAEADVQLPTDGDMRAFSISCSGGRGYQVSDSLRRESNGLLGAFLKVADEKLAAVEIQRKFVGGRGADDEETELIAIDLPDSSVLDSKQSASFSPKRAYFSVADSVGRFDIIWKVKIAHSNLKIAPLDNGTQLLTGYVNFSEVKREGKPDVLIQIACVLPSRQGSASYHAQVGR